MSELKRCPICGGEAEIERIGTMKQSMIIACTNCGCRVESGDVQGLTKPESYKWNMRTRDAENAQLRESIKGWRNGLADIMCDMALMSKHKIADQLNDMYKEMDKGGK